MACFANINVSQGNVATYARCGGIFNIHLTTNLSMNVRQSHGHESMPPLFGPHRRLARVDTENHALGDVYMVQPVERGSFECISLPRCEL